MKYHVILLTSQTPFLIFDKTLLSLSLLVPVITTLKNSPQKTYKQALPIPEEPPVITATLFFII